VRLVLACLFALYVLFVAALPHGHEEAAHHAHECIACTTAGAEPCPPAQPSVAPPVAMVARIEAAPQTFTPSGAPLGAIPGQSPPAA
jgi:hypothetical protein